jgi:hypothetical protein
MPIEQRDQSGEFAPHLASFKTRAFPQHLAITDFQAGHIARKRR